MKKDQTVHQWGTKSEYYDTENGEEISKQLAIRDYDIIKKRYTYEIENHYGTKTIINECEKKRQTKLWK